MPIAVRTLSLAVPATAALLGLVAAINPVLAVAGSLAIAFILLMVADLAIGVCLFAFASALFEAVPEFGGFSAAKLVGLTLGLSWLAALTVSQDLREEIFTRAPTYTAVLVLFATWAGLSILWAEDPGNAMIHYQRLALNLLLVPMVFSAVRNERTLRLLIGSFLAGMLCSATYGFFTGAAATPADEGRLSGAGLDPNYLALWLVVAAMLAVGLLARRNDPVLRGVMIGGIGLAILAALATASRTGLIALAAAVLVMPFFAGKGRRGAATLLTLVVIGGAGLYFTSFASSDVREHVTSASQDGGSGRTTIWRVGTRMAKANSATGVGIGNFQTSTVHYLLEPGDGITRSDHIIDNAKVAHNSYLEVWAELGIPGLTMYLLLIVAALVTALKSARRYAALALREHEAIARAVAVSIVGLAAGSFFISAENSKPLWLLLALGMVTSKLVARQEAAAA